MIYNVNHYKNPALQSLLNKNEPAPVISRTFLSVKAASIKLLKSLTTKPTLETAASNQIIQTADFSSFSCKGFYMFNADKQIFSDNFRKNYLEKSATEIGRNKLRLLWVYVKCE